MTAGLSATNTANAWLNVLRGWKGLGSIRVTARAVMPSMGRGCHVDASLRTGNSATLSSNRALSPRPSPFFFMAPALWRWCARFPVCG